jgi:hypothetical protein
MQAPLLARMRDTALFAPSISRAVTQNAQSRS